VKASNGKILLLDVDLTSGKIADLPLPETYRDAYLGGSNLGARLLWDWEVYKVGPLEPGNILLFLTGPLSGTNYPGAGRIQIMARSPLTGLWGESSLGGYLAAPLKKAGYDGIIIRGRADKPVYLEIDGYNGISCLVGAEDLWGLDTYQTEATLRRRYSSFPVEVASIGPAGEKLVGMASIVHRGHNIAARTGMGAVMGSKGLKAVVVSGRGKMDLVDEQTYNQLRKQAIQVLAEDHWAKIRKEWGTIGNLEWALQNRRAPTKNWQDQKWLDKVHAITGETLANTYLTGRHTCYGCPIVCKRQVKVGEGPFSMDAGPGPEFESAASLGTMLLNDNLPALLKANDWCNRLGIDTISAGGTIAWAMEAYERGLWDPKDLQGSRLEWGNAEAIVQLVEGMGRRQGFGAYLGNGTAAAAKRLGKGSDEFAVQVKGLELGYHHPRVARGMEITYATNPQGAVHMVSPNVDEYRDASYEEWVAQIARSADQSALPNSYVLCALVCMTIKIPELAQVLNSVTGKNWDEDYLTETSERGWYLKRMFNFKCGAGRDADGLPARIQKQIQEAGCDHADFSHALELYYNYRRIDESGYPYPDKLRSIGLEDLVSTAGHE
jgi:aldehyde:ferredoxin oxidoreductase